MAGHGGHRTPRYSPAGSWPPKVSDASLLCAITALNLPSQDVKALGGRPAQPYQIPAGVDDLREVVLMQALIK